MHSMHVPWLEVHAPGGLQVCTTCHIHANKRQQSYSSNHYITEP